MSYNINKHTKLAARGLAAAVLLVASGAIAQQPLAPRPAQRPAPVQRPAPLAPVQAQTKTRPKTRPKTKPSWKCRSGRPRLTTIGCCNADRQRPTRGGSLRHGPGHAGPGRQRFVFADCGGSPGKGSAGQARRASSGQCLVRHQCPDTESDEDPGIQAPFTNCTPNGCFAEFELKEELSKKLRTATGVGKVSFADAGTHRSRCQSPSTASARPSTLCSRSDSRVTNSKPSMGEA